MSRLRIYSDADAGELRMETRNPAAITEQLKAVGVGFSRWQAEADGPAIVAGASPESVLHAYRNDIAALMAAGGYQSVDVVSMRPDHPDRAVMRTKFLNEHTHAEDEIRFFVAGSGLFSIHTHAQVFEIECCQNDLINLPAGTKHWFDMGDAPFFVAIRIFTNASGWVAQFTGDAIAEKFPRYERVA